MEQQAFLLTIRINQNAKSQFVNQKYQRNLAIFVRIILLVKVKSFMEFVHYEHFLSFGTTQLSCKEKCSCWININCGGKGDDEVENYAELSTDKEVDKGEGHGKEKEDEKEEKDEKVGKARHGGYNNSDKAVSSFYNERNFQASFFVDR